VIGTTLFLVFGFQPPYVPEHCSYPDTEPMVFVG
jgi:hypothetical protein